MCSDGVASSGLHLLLGGIYIMESISKLYHLLLDVVLQRLRDAAGQLVLR